MMKKYVTYDKEEFEKNLERIRYKMYFIDSEIRCMERAAENGGAPWLSQENWDIISKDLRKQFKEMAIMMKNFGSEINFDFTPVPVREVLTEKWQ